MCENTNQSSNVKSITESPGIQNKLQEISYPAQIPTEEDEFLKLVSTLQCTLELGKLLELFDDEIKTRVSYDGFRYENPAEQLNLTYGHDSMHSLSYNLVLFENQLGTLDFFRNARFSDEEIQLIENSVAALIYPIRNALLYKRAVENAYRDPITSLNNRAAMDATLETEIDFATRHNLALSVLMIDIDYFKKINDTYGHIGGDVVLKNISECLEDCVRSSDALFRYGGEEFVVILRNTNKIGAELLASRIRQAIESMECRYNNHVIRVTASLGIAILDKNDDRHTFLERADSALYQAKKEGRNRVILNERSQD